MSRIKLLVVGDIHIGRGSSRVSADDPSEVSARGAWDRIVEAALSESVNLLCLTGDITDESNRFWEAIGPLERGLRQLEACGIMTLAVSGNHDHDALPRLADQLESASFRLLGRAGAWQRYTHQAGGEALLHVDGWSFPRESVRASPVDTYDLPADAAVPTLAMVHGDLDVADSRYAPLPRQRMLAKPVAGWLLGHIHAPMVEAPKDQPFIVYPGSPQALDPGETGVHGAVIVEFEHGRCLGVRRLPLSTVRYDGLEVDVAGVEDLSALTMRVHDEIESFAEQAGSEGGDRLRHLVIRLTLHGQTPLAGALQEEVEQIRADLELEVAGVTCSVDRVTLRVLPVVDLAALSRSSSPPATLATLLLELRERKPLNELSERSRRLTERVRTAMATQRRAAVFAGAADAGDLDDDAVREMVAAQAEALLAELVQQQGAS